MALPGLTLLSEVEINAIHRTSLAILEKTGVMIHHERVLECLAAAGAVVNRHTKIARLPETLVKQTLSTHQPEPMDPALVREIDKIVACAKQELG